MHWLYDLPVPLLAAVLMALSITWAVAAVLFVRRMRWRLSAEDNGTAAALHAFIGVMYAVALGLLVVSAQDDYGEVEEAVVTEANASGDLFRAMGGLEPASRVPSGEKATAAIGRSPPGSVRKGRSAHGLHR